MSPLLLARLFGINNPDLRMKYFVALQVLALPFALAGAVIPRATNVPARVCNTDQHVLAIGEVHTDVIPTEKQCESSLADATYTSPNI